MNIKFNKETEHDKLWRELHSVLPEVKALNTGYKFGVASVVYSIHKWCDELKEMGLEPTPDDIKNAYLDWISYDVEINQLFNRLLTADKEKGRKL
jgi:hypothetical protein